MKTNTNSLENKIQRLQTAQVKFWRALMACHDLLYKHFESHLQSKGLSYSRFQILFYIYFNPKSSASYLAEKMKVTRGNMSMFLKRMIEDKLIEEEIEKNKKRCTYKLSSTGLALFEKTLDVHLNEVQSILPTQLKSLEKDILNLTDNVKTKLNKD